MSERNRKAIWFVMKGPKKHLGYGGLTIRRSGSWDDLERVSSLYRKGEKVIITVTGVLDMVLFESEET
jgi:hypothetical protein